MCLNSFAAKGVLATLRALCLSCLAALLATSTLQAQTVQFVPVGNPGNTADSGGGGIWGTPITIGEVDYNYRIGTYDITYGQYTTFLNAVAKTDPYGLYESNVSLGIWGNLGIIQQTGNPGSYSYSIAAVERATGDRCQLDELPHELRLVGRCGPVLQLAAKWSSDDRG